MSVSQAFHQTFLNAADSTVCFNAFQSIVQSQPKIVFDNIRSFLTDREFSLRVIQVYKPTNIGRIYQLEGVEDTNGLKAVNLGLGKLYQHARCFELTELISLITLKLQDLWNTYPDLFHLRPLLEITVLIFPDEYDESNHDPLQTWMLRFFAETYDLLT
ncbi:hypothetical protein N7508_008547 [Penicillium antarcticum]|uniref:uncharacterized protein n=1 Tax=Penicillium antarcticum TaxID=416450 RepID=UPI0023927928|nr:uncharacterized protein N7508_008547 [Penicillium antarcticum]KAJ5293726.1 hypothetical protein N7508_008547 [Penicillium antarcticum]